jgi:folate-binding protein YgfZ
MARLDAGTVEILRIEAGIPASVADIDGDVLPPETLQIERGISYRKGCYLGQEVIERMRSHGVISRKLVGIRLEGDVLPARDASVLHDEQPVGRVTSACRSEAVKAVLALGYVKSARAAPGTPVIVQDGPRRAPGEIVALPLR